MEWDGAVFLHVRACAWRAARVCLRRGAGVTGGAAAPCDSNGSPQQQPSSRTPTSTNVGLLKRDTHQQCVVTCPCGPLRTLPAIHSQVCHSHCPCRYEAQYGRLRPFWEEAAGEHSQGAGRGFVTIK